MELLAISEYDFPKASKVGCAKDGDFDFNQPLHIAFDANSAINSLVIGQVDQSKKVLKTINSMFVKTSRQTAGTG